MPPATPAPNTAPPTPAAPVAPPSTPAAPAATTAEKPATPAPGTNLVANADFAQFDTNTAAAPGWSISNASASIEKDVVDGGGNALAVQSQSANAELYQTLRLRPGATYELSFFARTNGAVRVRLFDEAAAAPLQGEAELTKGQVAYQYRFRFTVPGANGKLVPMRAPSFVIADSGTVLALDDVSVKEIGA